jgi:hypothetical protein
MYIAEFLIPGMGLTNIDAGLNSASIELIDCLEQLVYEANSALNLFQQVRCEPPSDRLGSGNERRVAIYKEIFLNEVTEGSSPEDIRMKVEHIYKNERWAAGAIPFHFPRFRALICAKSFVYALDSFEKVLAVLMKLEGAPSELQISHNMFLEAFPDLRSLRDTSHHIEDRLRKLDRKKRAIALKEFDIGIVSSPGGVVILNTLNGDTYCATLEDGTVGELDISPASLNNLVAIFERALASFSWVGEPRHCPS